MRIIGGARRGARLEAPEGGDVRPTADRVREAVFNILVHGIEGGDVKDAVVLDLFAGTGAMGLEALSRGAAHVTFIDNDETALRTLRANIRKLGGETQTTVLRSDVNLLEIDLIREGRRVPVRDPLPAFPYFVFLTRAKRSPITEYWPVAINGPLPRIPVPLRGGDADVWLDSQAALTSVYDTFNYEFLIEYGKPASPPLAGDTDLWADRRLREKGKR